MAKSAKNRLVAVICSIAALVMGVAFLPLLLSEYDYVPNEPGVLAGVAIDYPNFRASPDLFFVLAADAHYSAMRPISEQINNARSSDPVLYEIYRQILDTADTYNSAVNSLLAMTNQIPMAGVPNIIRIIDPCISHIALPDTPPHINRAVRAAGHILASHIAAAFLGDCEYLQSMAISNVLWYMRMGNYRMVISAIAELDLDLRDRAIDALVARIIAIYPHPIARMYGANLARPDIPYDADTLAVFAAINAALAPLNIPIVPALKITAYVNNTPHILLGHFIDNMPVFALRDISRILCGTQAQFALRSDSAAQFMIAHHAPYRPVVITMGTTPSPSNRPRLRISEGKPVYFIMGRSYVNPADFADALGFDMAWDGDNLIIDTREQAANENARRAARDFIAQFCGIFCEYAQSRRHTQATPYVRDFGVGYAVARFFSFYDFNGDGNPDIIVHFGGGLDSVLFRLIDDQYQEIAILPYNASSNVFTDPTGRIITRFQTFQEVGYFALEYAQGSWQTTQLSRETPIFGMHRVPFDIGPAENFSMEDFWRHYNRNRHGYTPDNNTTPDIPLNPIHRMIVEEQITRAALNHPPTKPQPPLPQNPHPILVNN